jgi:hypothetical protein
MNLAALGIQPATGVALAVSQLLEQDKERKA